jgi:hypothetical protein
MPHGSFSYFGDQRLHFMKRLFRAWHRQLADFEDLLYNDLPYWYSERTNIGVLAAAALRLKTIVPLEEYPIRRGDNAGRADLGLYNARNERWYDFEFKFRWIAIGFSATKTIRDAMRDASRDVKALPKPPARSQSVAVTFVVPYLPKTKSRKPPPMEKRDSWKHFLHSVAKPTIFGADFVAVHRADDGVVERAARNEAPEADFHLGIAAFGKVIHRR